MSTLLIPVLSAGFAPGSEAAFINLHNLLAPGFGLGHFLGAYKQTNFFAENGLNIATKAFWFNQQGTCVGIQMNWIIFILATTPCIS